MSPNKSQQNSKSTFSRIGPAIIVAAVVCGPGSIVTSSSTGAQFGYSAIWVLCLACVLMIGMVALSMRIGLAFGQTPCGELSDRLGRPVAALIGLIMFLIVACFQSSNNFAVVAAFEAMGWNLNQWAKVIILAIANAIAIGFLFGSRNLYGVVERVMKVLVLLMVVAFLINCLVARPSINAIVQGLVPTVPQMDKPQTEIWILVGLIATTFSIAAAFYQAYLVREKGWTEADRQAGFWDTIVGVTTLGAISLVIMVTSAAVFYGTDVVIDDMTDIAMQLRPLFGNWAQVIFGVGIFAAVFSSFLVNAMIGGHVAADGFGLGEKLSSRWTQILTTAALLAGMSVALYSISTGTKTRQLIIFAQALTVVGGPALALALLYLGIQKRRDDKSAVPLWALILATAGFAITLLLATRTVLNIVDKLSQS